MVDWPDLLLFGYSALPVGERSGLKILVAEDDLSLRPILTRLCRSIEGSAEVIWTSSLNEAVTALERDPFDLIIADHLLQGDGTGIELWQHCRKLRLGTPV